MSLVEKAKTYAYEKHNNPGKSQRYGNAPYTKHLDDVNEIIDAYSFYLYTDDYLNVKAAGYLHDTVEDTDVSPKRLKEKFNKEIAMIVFRVSNERGFDRKEKNFKTYPKIWVCPLAIYLKLCDRIANTRNSKSEGHSMYKVYKAEYAIFRYALKVDNLYPEMWNELDKLNEYTL